MKQKVTRWGVKALGKSYWSGELLLHFGERVEVVIEETAIQVVDLNGNKITTFKR